MSDDEKLVEAVAAAIWNRQRLQPGATPVAHTWQQLCAEGVERYGKAPEWIGDRLTQARAAIATVRAHDAEAGMVTVPRSLMGSVQAVINPLSGFLKRQREGGASDRYLERLRREVRAVLTPEHPDAQ